jgi:hypothetical protein
MSEPEHKGISAEEFSQAISGMKSSLMATPSGSLVGATVERIAYLRCLPGGPASFLARQQDWDWLLNIAEAAAQLEPRVAVLMDRVYPPDIWLPDDLTETYEELGERRHEEGGNLDEGAWMVKRINASLPRLRDTLEAQP